MTKSELKEIIKECLYESGNLSMSNTIELEYDSDLKKYDKYLKRKVVYKDSFKDGKFMSKKYNYKIGKAVKEQIGKVIDNEEKLIKELFSKSNRKDIDDIYFDEFEVVDPYESEENTTKEFDIWAFTSKGQITCKIKNGKILKDYIKYND